MMPKIGQRYSQIDAFTASALSKMSQRLTAMMETGTTNHNNESQKEPWNWFEPGWCIKNANGAVINPPNRTCQPLIEMRFSDHFWPA